ncbi:phage tail protein [Paraflavitalea pollutisoli]|uniref:phage tail protein n=1 Tax=Paraflavitalea pollutisoli TaxID=3034143 RepID=UPI0023EBEC83|nr:tail fiber protein [Paraflavitalea sp. H1-2-19X]
MFVQPYLANVTIFAGNFAPRGWMYCRGQLLSIAENSALFALIGTIYGGDGQTTFALPNLSSRVAVHPGSSVVLGQVAGTESVTLTSGQLPVHTHTVISFTAPIPAATSSGSNTCANAVPGQPASNVYGASADGFGMAPADLAMNTPIAGGSQPVSLLPPYLAMNYIIAVEGVFPSRN